MIKINEERARKMMQDKLKSLNNNGSDKANGDDGGNNDN